MPPKRHSPSISAALDAALERQHQLALVLAQRNPTLSSELCLTIAARLLAHEAGELLRTALDAR